MNRSLPTIAAASLPPLAYAHGDQHDPRLTLPERFRPIQEGKHRFVKPHAGGLWTAPVTEVTADGEIVRTAWTDWCRDNMWGDDDADSRFLAVVPQPHARVLLIDTLDDLRAIVDAYPNPVEPYPFVGERYPNWLALASDWDAVYLTDDGQWATRLPPFGMPNLYTWDCATVLWLRPAYTVPVLVAGGVA
jgi:hypothetical protein